MKKHICPIAMKWNEGFDLSQYDFESCAAQCRWVSDAGLFVTATELLCQLCIQHQAHDVSTRSFIVFLLLFVPCSSYASRLSIFSATFLYSLWIWWCTHPPSLTNGFIQNTDRFMLFLFNDIYCKHKTNTLIHYSTFP